MKTEKINLDIDLIDEELYNKIIKEFTKTSYGKPVFVKDIKISAILEIEE